MSLTETPDFTRSANERRSGDRRETEGSGPAGEERRSGGRRQAQADRRTENNLQLATFFLNGEFFGVPVDRVQEILLAQEMTPVPNADPSIRGLVNLRGQIVTAIDPRRVLGMPDVEDLGEQMNVIVNFTDGADSLLVDEVGDVLEVSAAKIEPPPASMTGVERKFVEGVCKLDNRLLLILDVYRLTGRVEGAATT